MSGWVDEWRDGWMNEWMNEWQIHRCQSLSAGPDVPTVLCPFHDLCWNMSQSRRHHSKHEWALLELPLSQDAGSPKRWHSDGHSGRQSSHFTRKWRWTCPPAVPPMTSPGKSIVVIPKASLLREQTTTFLALVMSSKTSESIRHRGRSIEFQQQRVSDVSSRQTLVWPDYFSVPVPWCRAQGCGRRQALKRVHPRVLF